MWHCLTDMKDFHYFKYEANQEEFFGIIIFIFEQTLLIPKVQCAKHISLLIQLNK